MATATARSFDVATLDGLKPETEDDGRAEFNIRRHFDIRGFGVRANRAVGDGHVINEHDEVGIGLSGQEELYLVVSGAATFNVDGERVEAPAGTLVFVRNPAAKRSAVATEDGTTVLAIGGTPGEAYRISAGEAMSEMWEPYRAGDYETALEKLQPVLQERPETLVYFNIACMEARLGRADDAIGHLQQAVEADDRIKENIRTDEDLDSLRDDPRFAKLAA